MVKNRDAVTTVEVWIVTQWYDEKENTQGKGWTYIILKLISAPRDMEAQYRMRWHW